MTVDELLAEFEDGEFRTVVWVESITIDKGQTLTRSGILHIDREELTALRPRIRLSFTDTPYPLRFVIFVDELVSIA